MLGHGQDTPTVPFSLSFVASRTRLPALEGTKVVCASRETTFPTQITKRPPTLVRCSQGEMNDTPRKKTRTLLVRLGSRPRICKAANQRQMQMVLNDGQFWPRFRRESEGPFSCTTRGSEAVSIQVSTGALQTLSCAGHQDHSTLFQAKSARVSSHRFQPPLVTAGAMKVLVGAILISQTC
jgi:hypothetical protein